MKHKIDELCEIVNGQTPSTKNADYWDGNIPWITPKDMSLLHGKYIGVGERSITQQGFDSCSTAMVPAGTILLTSRAPIGYLAIASRPLCTNQGFKSLIVKSPLVINEFLYYWLTTKTEYLRGIAGGSTFRELSKPQLGAVEIDLPDVHTQQHIVDVRRTHYDQM